MARERCGRLVVEAAALAALVVSGCSVPPPLPPPSPGTARADATDPAIGCVSAVPDELPPGGDRVSILEARVLAFSRAHIGRVLGSGQCAELAEQALLSSGARTFTDYAEMTAGDDYVWGSPVDVAEARPGDVLQFRNFTASISTRTARGTMSDDSDAEHHTVVVEANRRGDMTVFEANVDDDPSVRRSHYYVISGTYPGSADGAARGGAVTAVRVSGSVHAYRPAPR